MKRLIVLLKAGGLSMAFWAVMGSSALAMCVWFAPPGRVFEPANNIKTLIVKNGSDQKFVVQPQFSGDAVDFALVMPFGAQPEIKEAPKRLFERLEDLTNPEQDFFIDDCIDCGPVPLALDSRQESSVEVVEQRDVGEYAATTLRANDADELLQWLNDNGYDVPDSKQRTLNYYVGNDTAYFVALKVNLDEANIGTDGQILGELDPISFEFKSDEAMLPLRLMSDEQSTDRINLVVYAMGDEQLYIPGAELQYAQKLSDRNIRDAQLDDFANRSDWLVRNNIALEPSEIEVDLTLLTTPEDLVIDAQNEGTIRLNPDLLDDKTGLISPVGPRIKYLTDSSSQNPDSSKSDSNDSTDYTPALIGLVVFMGVANLLLLGTVLRSKT